MQDAITLYAPPHPATTASPCPVHHGESYNLSFTDKLYRMAPAVMSYTSCNTFSASFLAALDKLNTDFDCGAILDRRPTHSGSRERHRGGTVRLWRHVGKKKPNARHMRIYTIHFGTVLDPNPINLHHKTLMQPAVDPEITN